MLIKYNSLSQQVEYTIRQGMNYLLVKIPEAADQSDNVQPPADEKGSTAKTLPTPSLKDLGIGIFVDALL